MDPNNNRLHLNFGFNDRNYNAANNRVYPTTPSAFPQPIYQGQDYMDPHSAQNAAYGQGYFLNNPYPQQPQQPQQAHYPIQQQQQQQYGAHNLQSPQAAYGSRMPYNNGNDGTNGLIQQFSNQDLSASPRPGLSPRAPSPGQRPRTAGSTAPQQQPGGHLAPLMASRSPKPQTEEEELQRFPERYSENVHKRGKAAKELINVFFQENIERARERNMR
jgi:protein-serine/threonine kinase